MPSGRETKMLQWIRVWGPLFMFVCATCAAIYYIVIPQYSLERAAERGDREAQFELAKHYDNRKVPSALGGKSNSKLADWDALNKRGDYVSSRDWYRKAAEQGHAQAQNNLGVLYLFGLGGEKSRDEGFKWICKAAEQRLLCAQKNVRWFKWDCATGRLVSPPPSIRITETNFKEMKCYQ